MAKISKEEKWRQEGISYAIRFLESGKSLEELIADAKRRQAYDIPIWVTPAMDSEYSGRVKQNVMRTVLLMSCAVLMAEFDFGNHKQNGKPGRLDRFISKFNKYCGDMIDGEMDWRDLQQQIEHDTGLHLPIWFT